MEEGLSSGKTVGRGRRVESKGSSVAEALGLTGIIITYAFCMADITIKQKSINVVTIKMEQIK